mgnify:FL=1
MYVDAGADGMRMIYRRIIGIYLDLYAAQLTGWLTHVQHGQHGRPTEHR